MKTSYVSLTNARTVAASAGRSISMMKHTKGI